MQGEILKSDGFVKRIGRGGNSCFASLLALAGMVKVRPRVRAAKENKSFFRAFRLFNYSSILFTLLKLKLLNKKPLRQNIFIFNVQSPCGSYSTIVSPYNLA